jgi:Tfp pilus assembly protein FimT
MYKNRFGLTYIELLVVLGLFAIISLFSFSSYASWQKEVTLVNSTDELKSTISLAQAKAIAAAGNKNWGVHFEADQYVLFSGSFYDLANPDNKIKELRGVQILNPNTTLSDGAAGYGADLVFSKYTGQTVNIGQITVVANTDATKTKIISIQDNGQIN